MSICKLIKDMMFNSGAMEFKPKKLKHHEKDPGAPPSPYFFNIRTPDNPKPGQLMPED
jgi:hypothetical protein